MREGGPLLALLRRGSVFLASLNLVCCPHCGRVFEHKTLTARQAAERDWLLRALGRVSRLLRPIPQPEETP